MWILFFKINIIPATRSKATRLEIMSFIRSLFCLINTTKFYVYIYLKGFWILKKMYANA
jgi:hypothetical protein